MMMQLSISTSVQQFKEHIQYSLRHLLRVNGLDAQDDPLKLIISYGPSIPKIAGENHLHIYSSQLFSKNYMTLASLPQRPISRLCKSGMPPELALDEYEGLPCLFMAKDDKTAPAVYWHKNTLCTSVDLLGSTFFCLTRYEEIVRPCYDEYGRFPGTASTAVKDRFIHRPVVDEYANLLRHLIAASTGVPGTSTARWPAGAEMAACLTHDVDVLRKYRWIPPVRRLRSAMSNETATEFTSLVQDYAATIVGLRPDTYANVDAVKQAEEARGLRGSYYFLVGARNPRDLPRRVSVNQRLRDLAVSLSDAGHEIGLHPGYHTFMDSTVMGHERETLLNDTGIHFLGGRQHMLRWRAPMTWRIWSELGMRYDSSLAYADYEGFRAGTTWPFQAFDAVAGEELGLWELPLTVMDNTLSDYRQMTPSEGAAVIESLIQTVRQHAGVFVILWHHNFDAPHVRPGWKGIWPHVLDTLGQSNAWIAPARDVVARIEQIRTADISVIFHT